jgi:hypothetical protein
LSEEDFLRDRIRRSLELAAKVDDREVSQHLQQMAGDYQRLLDERIKRAEQRKPSGDLE